MSLAEPFLHSEERSVCYDGAIRTGQDRTGQGVSSVQDSSRETPDLRVVAGNTAESQHDTEELGLMMLLP